MDIVDNSKRPEPGAFHRVSTIAQFVVLYSHQLDLVLHRNGHDADRLESMQALTDAASRHVHNASQTARTALSMSARMNAGDSSKIQEWSS